jgi:hypothetical protein
VAGLNSHEEYLTAIYSPCFFDRVAQKLTLKQKMASAVAHYEAAMAKKAGVTVNQLRREIAKLPKTKRKRRTQRIKTEDR